MAKFNRSKKPAAEEASAPPEALSDANIAAALDKRYGGEPLVVAEVPPAEETSEDVLPEAPEALGEDVLPEAPEALGEDAPVTSESYDGPGYAAPTFSYVEAAAKAEAANLLTPSSTKGNANGAPEELPPAPRDNSKGNFERERARLFSAVGALGKDNGKGKKSLVALVDVLLDAAEAGLITPGTDSGKGEDDAVKLYKRFRKDMAEASGKYAPADQDDDSLKAQASKLRQIIKAGASGIDGVKDVFNSARDMHIAALGNQDKELLKHKGTYEALVQIAREQLKEDKRGIAMSEEQIRDALFTEEREAKDKTGLDYIKSAYKAACAARDGKAATESKEARAPIDHGNLENAIGWLDAVIRDLDPSYFDKIEAEAAQKMATWAARQANKKAA